jgi:hypothetical protein
MLGLGGFKQTLTAILTRKGETWVGCLFESRFSRFFRLLEDLVWLEAHGLTFEDAIQLGFTAE